MRFAWIVLLVLIIGCGEPPSAKVREREPEKTTKKEDKTKVKKASASDYWVSLADSIEKEELTSSSHLAAVVVMLANEGKLSEADVEKFGNEFPGIQKGDRSLSDEDAKKLRGLSK